jgi:hypothetical protein
MSAIIPEEDITYFIQEEEKLLSQFDTLIKEQKEQEEEGKLTHEEKGYYQNLKDDIRDELYRLYRRFLPN